MEGEQAASQQTADVGAAPTADKRFFLFPAVVERSVTSKLPFLHFLPLLLIFLPFTVRGSKL
jgi:hypothetical protein